MVHLISTSARFRPCFPSSPSLRFIILANSLKKKCGSFSQVIKILPHYLSLVIYLVAHHLFNGQLMVRQCQEPFKIFFQTRGTENVTKSVFHPNIFYI